MDKYYTNVRLTMSVSDCISPNSNFSQLSKYLIIDL